MSARAPTLLTEWLAPRGCHARSTLAKQLDTSPSAVQHWQRGRAIPSLKSALGLRILCGIELEDWLDPEEGDSG
jgi:ribosome-binding protein aMBF1 (putative translation factor)